MERSLPAAALPWRVLGAWADLRGSMRAELDRAPGEGRLLLYVMLSGLVWFLGRAAVLSWGEEAPFLSADEYTGRLTAEFFAALSFRTLAFYALAALAGALARGAGGTGGWRASRAALFWAALVAAPAVLAATLLSVLLTGMPGHAAQIASALGAVAFAWAFAHCLTEAQGFASPWRVLAAIVACVAVATGLSYLLATTLLSEPAASVALRAAIPAPV
jgi:hypothetical protein